MFSSVSGSYDLPRHVCDQLRKLNIADSFYIKDRVVGLLNNFVFYDLI